MIDQFNIVLEMRLNELEYKLKLVELEDQINENQSLNLEVLSLDSKIKEVKRTIETLNMVFNNETNS